MGEQEIRKLLADKLKEYRERAGMTIKEAGSAIGKSEKTISAWEHGRGQPDADMLFSICKLYGIKSIGVFYGEENTMQTSTNDEAELLSLYRSMAKEGRKLALDTIRAFAGNPNLQNTEYQSAAAIARSRARAAEQEGVRDGDTEAHA